jgi:hypothetical protein
VEESGSVLDTLSLVTMHKLFQASIHARKHSPGDWGIFSVNGDSLTIQLSKKTSRGWFPVTIDFIKYRGKVLSNNSFEVYPISQDYHGIQGIYKFKEYKPKPDSINWIKEELKKKKK